MFYRHYPDLPQRLRETILQDGLTTELYSRMQRIIREQQFDFREFAYSERERSYECELDGYSFRLVHNSRHWRQILQGIHSPHGKHPDFGTRFPQNGVVRMAMFAGGKAIATIELSAIATLHWNSSGFIDEHAFHAAKLRIAFLHWLKWTGLWQKYGPYHAEDYEYLMQETEARPLGQSECV